MNLRIPTIGVVLSLLVFSACSNSRKSVTGKQEQNSPAMIDTLHKPTGSKTAIRENSAVILGKILDKKVEGENDFELMVMVKESDDTLNYESLVVKDMVYHMKPAFTMENGKIKPVEKNKKLLDLMDLPKGSTFRARVSLTEGNKCLIQEVLGSK